MPRPFIVRNRLYKLVKNRQLKQGKRTRKIIYREGMPAKRQRRLKLWA